VTLGCYLRLSRVCTVSCTFFLLCNVACTFFLLLAGWFLLCVLKYIILTSECGSQAARLLYCHQLSAQACSQAWATGTVMSVLNSPTHPSPLIVLWGCGGAPLLAAMV